MYNKTNTTNIKIMCWNAQSIMPKLIELIDFLNSNPIDIIVVTETWLNKSKKMYIPNYIIYRLDRQDGNHGGVAILIKNNITHSIPSQPNTKAIEALSVNITTNNTYFTISAVYFPGTNVTQDRLNVFKKDIQILTSSNKSFFICGDLNAKHTSWNNVRGNRAGKILYGEMTNRNFTIENPPSPTCYPPQSKALYPSTIDLILTNKLHDISQPQILQKFNSDHLPFTFNILSSRTINPIKKYFRYDLANWNSFRSHINSNLNPLSPPPSSIVAIDFEISSFTSLIKSAEEISVPKKTHKTNNLSLPGNIKYFISKRNSIRRQWQRTRCRILFHELKILSKSVNNMITNFRNSLFHKKIENLEPSSNKFWKATKLLKNKTNSIPPLVDPITKKLILTNEEKASEIAKNFYSAHLTSSNIKDHGTEMVVLESIHRINSTSITREESHSILTTPSEIRLIIKKLKTKKSPGQDHLSNKVLKQLSKRSIIHLTKIFNACLVLGYFPQVWKTSKIIAIPKPNKNLSDPSCYRPISLLTSLSKILERILLQRLTAHVTLNNILPNEQFGFRSAHSTSHQLLRLVQDIRSKFLLKQSTGMIALDIEKAFDSLWHDGLLHKMLKLNFHPLLIKIIKSFLFNRQFYVQIFNGKSPNFPIPFGVPQGSALSPLLYNIYTHDLQVINPCKVALFADDTAIYSSDSDPEIIIANLEIAINSLSSYYHKWKIKINSSKTQTIFFTRRRSSKFLPDRNILINNTPILWANEIKYLGCLLDTKLLFKKHIDFSVVRAQKYIKMFYPLINRRSPLNTKNKLLIYKSIFRPMLLYACNVWGDSAKTHLNKLQITQNKCLKLLLNLPYYYNTINLHTLAGIGTIGNSIDLIKTKFQDMSSFSDNPLISGLRF